jgi:chemotaxis protein MotB
MLFKKKFTSSLLFWTLLMPFVFSCVKPKLYKTEKTARILAEEREKVLQKELADRKTEAAALIKSAGDMNKVIGSQEVRIGDLTRELSNITRQQGESSAKLSAEKNTLERDLAEKTAVLTRKEAALQRIKTAAQQRTDSLQRMAISLNKAYETYQSNGISVTMEGETVLVSFPDKALFTTDGLSVSDEGRSALGPLAAFLSARPELDVDVQAHTDNVLPSKNKTLKDTWDWSLQRAVGVTRLLIREHNVNANQLNPVGKGEFYPITSNETAEGREKNRRTVLVIRAVLPVVPTEE